MSKHNTPSTPPPGQANRKKIKDIGHEDGWWHTHEQREIAQLDGNLSELEKAFSDEIDERNLERKDQKAEKEILQEVHEQTITCIRTMLGTRIRDLTTETG